jgi:Domain of unknown function (DUF4274)
MLGKLLPASWPLSGRGQDHLFAPIPGGLGGSTRLLASIYNVYRNALPDEPITPAHKHFGALVDDTLGLGAPGLDAINGLDLKRVRSAYVCCFEPTEHFQPDLSQWRYDAEFKDKLLETRARLIEELTPYVAEERAQRAHLSRFWECMETPVDIAGASLMQLIQQMSPDDWHEIVLRWNWDHGVDELDWITRQPDCDRATAAYALCRGNPDFVATRPKPAEHRGRWDYSGFVLALASRLENGFYVTADLSLDLNMTARAAFSQRIAAARATGVSPWQLPGDLLTYPGVRAHRPKYTLCDGSVHFHYEYWLDHVAPSPRHPKVHRFIGLMPAQ